MRMLSRFQLLVHRRGETRRANRQKHQVHLFSISDPLALATAQTLQEPSQHRDGRGIEGQLPVDQSVEHHLGAPHREALNLAPQGVGFGAVQGRDRPVVVAGQLFESSDRPIVEVVGARAMPWRWAGHRDGPS